MNESLNYLPGIDLSHWNGSINFGKVKQWGVKLVYLKATEGLTHVDDKLQEYYVGARAAGLKIGFYHFFLPGTLENARQQARHFLETIQPLPGDCCCALDVETNKNNLDKPALCRVIQEFIEYFGDASGQGMMLYASHHWLKEQLIRSLCPYPVWIAQWTKATQPQLLPEWGEWQGWQYSAEGKIPGIAGQVDLNWFKQSALLEKKPALR